MRFGWFLCVFVHCCVFLRVYECFFAFVHVFVPFGCSGSLLGRSWAFLEGSWGALGAILEQSWTLWVTLGTPLGRSWGDPRAMLDLSCEKTEKTQKKYEISGQLGRPNGNKNH